MADTTNGVWIDDLLPLHKRLTESVVTILENILKFHNIDYLAISGRTKDRNSAIEKVKRKGYKHPKAQMTDLSGIRLILYFESDVKKVSKLIDRSFQVDVSNSMNQDELLSSDQLGYRSVHFVCDLGNDREGLPEFSGLENLKFEIQIRTVLQHAWAELAHDRNYKFSGKLPKALDRKLYLYAGMLEIADRGFDEVSSEIDEYIKSVNEKSNLEDLYIDYISLTKFVEKWAENEGVQLSEVIMPQYYDELIGELKQFGVNKIADLKEIIPNEYAKNLKKLNIQENIIGTVREWMVISDFRRFSSDVDIDWFFEISDLDMLEYYFTDKELEEFKSLFVIKGI